MKLHCNLRLGLVFICAVSVGGIEEILVGILEPLVRYHSNKVRILTLIRNPVREHSQVGSLTGAVASQKVTEAHKGFLRSVRNRSESVKA